MDLREALTLVCRHPAGQAAMAADTRYAGMLMRSPNLLEQTWLTLWGTRPSAARAEALVEHPLLPGCIDRVLATERRVGVMTGLLQYSELDDAQGRQMMARPDFGRFRQVWVSSGLVPKSLLGEAAAGLTPAERAVSRHLFDQDEMLDMLAATVELRELMHLAHVLLLHPNAGVGVQQAAYAATERARGRSAFGSGAYLSRNAQTRKVHPFALTRPWEEADTDAEFETLIRLRNLWQLPAVARQRVQAYQLRQFPRDPWPTNALGKGAHVPVHASADEVPLDAAYLHYQQVLALAERVVAVLDDADRDVWTAALTLIADGYAGTAPEVALTAQALTRDQAVMPALEESTGRHARVPRPPASEQVGICR